METELVNWLSVSIPQTQPDNVLPYLNKIYHLYKKSNLPFSHQPIQKANVQHSVVKRKWPEKANYQRSESEVENAGTRRLGSRPAATGTSKSLSDCPLRAPCNPTAGNRFALGMADMAAEYCRNNPAMKGRADSTGTTETARSEKVRLTERVLVIRTPAYIYIYAAPHCTLLHQVSSVLSQQRPCGLVPAACWQRTLRSTSPGVL